MRKLKSVALFAATTAVALSATPVLAQDNPLKDVPPNHWAYKAVTQLQQDGIVQGYPDGYFKGQRPLTRYEMAVVVARAMSKLESELANASTANQVKPEDIEALRKLVDEYGTELKDVQKDVADLKTQTAANTAALKRQQFHLYYFLRAPGTWQDLAAVYGANGLPVASGTHVTGPNQGVGQGQGLISGVTSHGTAYQVLRMVFKGDVNDKVSYSIRLENRYYMDSVTNSAGGNSGSGTTPAPGGSGYPNNATLRINWANVSYTDPSGFNATVGRFVDGDGDIGLAWSDYFNGARIGYAKGPASIYAFYSWNLPSNSNTLVSNYNPTTGAATVTNNPWQTVAAHAQYNLAHGSSSGHIGVGYISDIDVGASYYNSTTGILVNQIPSVALGEVDATWAFNKIFQVQLEGLTRFGNDPSTGTTWKDQNAFWGKAFIGPSGHTGDASLELGFIGAGQNSLGPHNEVNGTPDYEQLYFNGNPNGYQIAYAGAHYYFGPGAKVSLFYEGYRINPSAALTSISGPVAAGAGPCVLANGVNAGCYATRDDGRAIFLQTLLSF